MALATVRVSGLHETVRAFGKIDKELRREVQRGLRDAAKPVSDTARGKLGRFPGAAVTGIRPRVRGSSAFVEQTKGKVTGKRGDFGSIIMQKVLIPALSERQHDVIQKLEDVIDRLGGDAGF